MQKKLLSLTLAFLMYLSLLPAPALATDSATMDISQLIIEDDLSYDSAYAYNSYIKVSRNTDGKPYSNRCGLLDCNGNESIPVIYGYLEVISDDLVIVGQDLDNNPKTGDKNTGVDKYGLADVNGNLIVPLKYDRIDHFYENMAAVCLNNKMGFIDKAGKEVIPPIYNINVLSGLEVWSTVIDSYGYRAGFSDGVACVRKDGKCEVIDKQGNVVLQQQDIRTGFSEGLALVSFSEGGGDDSLYMYAGDVQPYTTKYGYINKQGEIAIPAVYDIAHDFSEGYAVVGKKNANGEMMYGAIDQKGNIVVPIAYQGMTPFCEGMARVYKRDETKSTYANKYGFVDTTGKLVVPMIYTSAENYSNGMAVVSIDDDRFEDFQRRYGSIDKKGNIIIPLEYSLEFEFTDGIAYVCVGCPSTMNPFDDPDYQNRIYARFKELGINPECGYINTTGELVLSFGDRGDNYFYDSIFSGKIGAYRKLNDKYAIIQNPFYKENPQGTTPVSTPEKAQSTNAAPTQSTVLVNGKSISFDAYSINDNNYFKLRDLAQALSGTGKQFEVTWDGEKQAINLISNKPYTAVGGELAKGDGTRKTAQPSTSAIFLDGQAVQLTAYTINGNNYFKLRDIGATFDFSVAWDGTKNTIAIDTASGYTAE